MTPFRFVDGNGAEVDAVTEFLRHMLADKLQDPHLLIGVAAASTGSVHKSIDPSTCEVVGAYVSAGRAEAQAAIAAARSTFDTTVGPAIRPCDRGH